jgi:two-component system CheB/CheR fusion protein
VTLQGGQVEVSSAGRGRGAEFRVRLPLAAPPVEAVPVPSRSTARQRRILVIDDGVDAANLLRDVLALEGHEVHVAYDGPSGIRIAHEFQPEVIICDIGLPGMDGYQVARALRADSSLQGAYLVALSGYAQTEDRERAVRAGFDRHLPKPATPEQVEAALTSVPY